MLLLQAFLFKFIKINPFVLNTTKFLFSIKLATTFKHRYNLLKKTLVFDMLHVSALMAHYQASYKNIKICKARQLRGVACINLDM